VKTGYIDVAGTELAVEIEGSGPPVVLLKMYTKKS